MREDADRRASLGASRRTLAAACAGAVVLMANLNALVDLLLHPEIPYLDDEHLIVGGVTAAVTAGLAVWAVHFFRRLQSARERIRSLESFLPICSHCKKIRSVPRDDRSGAEWTAVESYFHERDGVHFTHGICPECERAYYS
ncbi:MAG: hypothetical protein HY079_08115 [Elusimicrobia bacterium]|nr:hypothetical protein [Elusimicrobiota bacterium]